MKEKSELIIIKNNFFSKIVRLLRNFLDKSIIKEKVEEDIKHKAKKQDKVYFVEYDTDPSKTDYGDIYIEDRIIRNSPYTKAIKKPIKESKRPYTKEEKNDFFKKYSDYLNNKIKAEELKLDEIIILNKLIKEELKIRKNR